MGSGTGEVSTPGVLPKDLQPPKAAPDATDDLVLQAQKAAMRAIQSKRGLQSTFLTTPAPGAPQTFLG